MSRSATGSRTALSRVTLVGERRRVDLVLPAREPIGVLLPEVMRVLDDRVGARPQARHLVTADGSALAHDSSLESAGVPDGAVLRLVRVEDAPSAPVVHDVSDEVADDLDVRAWRWRPGVRRVVAGLATLVWAVTAGVLAREQFEPSAVGTGLFAVAGVCAAAGLLCGRARRRGLATTLIVTAGALAALGAWTCADAYGWAGPLRLAGLAVSGAAALLLAGWFTPLGRGALIGAGAVGGCLVLWEAAIGLQGGAVSGSGQARAGALLAVASVVVLGVLPRLALMASGLTALDDRRTGGASVSRYQVATALGATHRALALATVVLAGSAAAAGVLVLRSVSVWTVLLALVVMTALGLRARAFPLTAEVVGLLLAAGILAVRLVVVWLEHTERTGAAGPVAVLALLAVVPLVVLTVEPAEHVRVRLRRVGDVLESVAVISLFPLVIGVFGVYGRLLGTFA
ncbi:type VII secretion integral membrane protein EccD [Streptomyces sp. HUCO-GS316]|uniref:type VII secretion integral membrane protein EccD n=1 Tax=Streptomyces sp. HUCO-GS316 TaxID=2692198 RepID=UPI0013714526|nr:type VII secretion integral membrane protein EccD [Streptomyces sp. HUCO-GS316]MXM68482.1 type VII secretion integral membrane protein EccD [Streptomyces sp. HUCO-GS316]